MSDDDVCTACGKVRKHHTAHGTCPGIFVPVEKFMEWGEEGVG